MGEQGAYINTNSIFIRTLIQSNLALKVSYTPNPFSPHRLLSSLANLQQRIQAMSELKPPMRKINPVASLPPPSTSSPILLNTRANFSAAGGEISAPGPTPAPACPAPGSTPLFSPGLPSNIAKMIEDTPVTRNWGTTMATL